MTTTKFDEPMFNYRIWYYHEIIVPIINQHGGTIDKFMGDGVLVHFGAASHSSSYAKDSMKTIQDIINHPKVNSSGQTETTPGNLVINISVAIGPVLFGATGVNNRLEMTIIGRTVNLAAKLEKFNKELNSQVVLTNKVINTAKEQGFLIPNNLYSLAKDQTLTELNTPIDLYYIPNLDQSKKLAC